MTNVDEKVVTALAEAIGDTGAELDDDARALTIIEMLAAKDIRVIDFTPGELTMGPPMQIGPTLRDVFTGEILNNFMSRISIGNVTGSKAVRNMALADVRDYAKFAFEAADIVLEEREGIPLALPTPQAASVWSTLRTGNGNYAVLAPNQLWYECDGLDANDAVDAIMKIWALNRCEELTAVNVVDTSDIPEADEEWFKRAETKKIRP